MVKLGLMFETNSMDLISLAKKTQVVNKTEEKRATNMKSDELLLFSYDRLKKKPSPEGIDLKNLHV
jgi:hypothetical protein